MHRLLVAAFLALSVLSAAPRPAQAQAAAAPPPLEAYGTLPALSEVALSPSGARMAMIVDDGKTRKLMVTALPGGLLAEFPVGKVKIRDIVWAGEDHVLVSHTQTYDFGSDFGFKHEVAQTLVVDLAHGKTFFVFDANKTISNMVFGFEGSAQIDGHWYGFFDGVPLNREGGLAKFAPNLYRVDLDTGAFQKAGDGTYLNRTWLVGADGRVLANSEFSEDVGQWRLYAGAEHGKPLYETTDKLDGAGLVSEGRTPGSIIYVTTDTDGRTHFRETRGADAGEELMPGTAISGIAVNPVTKQAIGVWQEGDTDVLTMFDPALQKRVDAVRRPFAGRRTAIVSASADFRRVVVFTNGPGDSGSYWLIDGAKASAIGYAYPAVGEAAVGPVRMVSYKAADGMEIHGVLTLPPGRDPKNLPLVVLPHGGPEARDRADFDWWAQAFASRGYAVFQPNFRGSTGYGPAFVRAGYGEWGRKMQTDISDGVADLARQGIVDPRRACIVGGSYGGYAALAGVTVQHGLYRCAVSWGGVSNPQSMLRRSAAYGGANPEARYWKLFMGARDAVNNGELDAISPLVLAGRADAPILLMHGKDDTVVPIQQSRDMAKALKGAGKPYEYVELPEDHWLSTGESRTAMLKAAVAFVLKYNPPD